MSTLASCIFTSLDGYEGPNAEIDWPVADEGFKEFALRQLDQADTDTLCFGTVNLRAHGGLLADRPGRGQRPRHRIPDEQQPKVVFSTSLDHASWTGGGELLVLGSAHLTASSAAAVLDELRIMAARSSSVRAAPRSRICRSGSRSRCTASRGSTPAASC